jgi:hypothetical protein
VVPDESTANRVMSVPMLRFVLDAQKRHFACQTLELQPCLLERLQAVGMATDTAAARIMDRLLGLTIRCGQQTHACMSGEGLREHALGALGATGSGGDNHELRHSAAEQKVMTAGWVTTKEVALLLGELFRCAPLQDAARANASAAADTEPTPPLDMSPSQHVDKKCRKALTAAGNTCAPLLTAVHFRRAGDYLLSSMLVMKHNGAIQYFPLMWANGPNTVVACHDKWPAEKGGDALGGELRCSGEDAHRTHTARQAVAGFGRRRARGAAGVLVAAAAGRRARRRVQRERDASALCRASLRVSRALHGGAAGMS